MERRAIAEIPDLHRRAANWYEGKGDLMACINHLLLAGASNEAADKVEACAMALIGQSHVLQLSDWLRKIPYEITAHRPRLLLVHVWLWFHMNKPVEAAKMLRAARRAITALRDTVSPAQYALWQAEMRTLAAGVTSAADRSTRARRIAERWAPQLPEDQPFLHGTLMNIRSYCDYSLGDLEAAKQASATARRSHVRAQSVFGIVYADLLYGLAEKAAGNLRQAAQLFARAQDIAEEALGEGSYAAALVGIFQCELHYEWDDLDEAARLLSRHREIVEDSALVVHEVVGKLMYTRLEAAAGRIDSALGQLDRVEHRQASATRRTRLSFAVLHERVKLLLQRGDTVGARLALTAVGIDPDVFTGSSSSGFCIPTSDFDTLAVTRLLIAEKQYARATAVLCNLNARLDRQGRGRRLMQGRLLLAFCRQQDHDQQGAADAIAASLPAMAQQNVIRSVVDEGALAANLLALLNQGPARQRIAAAAGSDHEMVEQYLAKLAALLVPASINVDASQRSGLSSRELEVLRLLSDGLSNRDLSRKLSISHDTVKWHLKNIFGKLGVDNRAQAILTAQRLRLVDIRRL
ncbi:LuxR C-terminal-related transcriptional regulator [Dongia soli]|uniref:LuxR C-terminal-related transcriptional regulator n=1 Tax=Dongia soli TaxID=600628 RepID=A0ABU5EGJ1_9PROT|nr:LuxR C-terminal-related transcriptional regulator [Dongia soli]MDY0885538.1 LuxR C-terminal-related transcriptional regulator [Dongia soli]